MKPDYKELWRPDRAGRYFARLDEYKDTVARLFPELPKKSVVDNWSIFPVDALMLGLFLEIYPRNVSALDVGTFIGTSAFCFASHPKVSEVTSVDPNPTVLDELADKSDAWHRRHDLEPLKNLKVLDVARAALAEFPEEQDKIRLCEGVVGSTQIGLDGKTTDSGKVEVPNLDPSEGTGLIAMVDGLHTRGGVRADLEAIFGQSPHAVVFLDDCRHRWGPFVQAGVVDFMEQAGDEYHFRLVGDFGPGLATSNLGLFYPESLAGEMKKIIAELGEVFSRRLDPLRLLRREEDLIAVVNRTNGELAQARQNKSRLEASNNQLRTKISQLEKRDSKRKDQISSLKKQNAQLVAHYSSRRYKIADAAAKSALRIPGLDDVLRRKPR